MILQFFNADSGKWEKARCFLDHGSNRSFVTTDCAKRCGFKTMSSQTLFIASFGQTAKKLKLDVSRVEFFGNRDSKDKFSSNVLIKDNIVGNLNSFALSEREQKFISEHGLTLADPEAGNNGSLEVDMLLGQDCVHSLTRGDSIILPGGSVLVPTRDGRYILAGPTDNSPEFSQISKSDTSPNFIVVNASTVEFPFVVKFQTPRKVKKLFTNVLACMTSEDELEIVESFRDLEALGIKPFEYEISPVLEEFDKTTTYDGKRYTVKLPFKEPQIKKLSNNFFQAFSRLMSGYKRRLKPKYFEEKEKYHQSFIDDLQNGILERVECLGTMNEIKEKLAVNPQFFNQLQMANDKPCCYLPHQCVYKQSTGKFRRVNDGAARPHKGAYSLNDVLEKGPDLMANILHILLGFRKNKWAAKADIEKAFPQVVIHPDHRDSLRCLWYEGDKIWIYRFARLPFGLSCSPMILAGVLQKHLSEKNVDEKTKQNFIASIYVDDSVWSEALLEELFQRKELYTNLFRAAGMNFRDWTSNHPGARKVFGEQEGKDPPLNEKVLGTKWNVEEDSLSINCDKVKELMGNKIKTKRHIWKLVPSIYDPLGLVSPYVQVGKEIVSRACDEVKGWDSPVPQKYLDEAREWASEFELLGDVKFQRFVGVENPKKTQLIGCCDASNRSLGACVYVLNTLQDGSKTCNLVLSKTRLAPKIKHSVPRLELLSAVLLTNLMKHVKVAYPEVEDSDIFWFTDSADVIFWLYSGHLSWRPFVANQIKKIRKCSLVQNWRHIDTSENPADLPSRGKKVSDLIGNEFWRHGPSFWLKDFEAGKSKLTGYDKHYKDLQISPSCKAELKSDIKNQLGMSVVSVASVIEKDSELSSKNKEELKSSLNNETCNFSLSIVQEITQEFFRNKKIACAFSNSSMVENTTEPTRDFPRMDKLIPDFETLIRSNIFSTLLYDHLMEVTNLVLKAASLFLGLIKRKPLQCEVPKDHLYHVSSQAEILWIQAVQQKYFSDLFKLCESPKAQVSSSSRILFTKHAVFLDKELNVLRCTTRNEKSVFEYATVYPILLPSTVRNSEGGFENCSFSKLLVEKSHEHCEHEGVPVTLSHLRSEFWILKGRRFVQKILHHCVTCKKIQGHFYSTTPSPSLPEFRVVKSRPWRGTGLDYLGHFWCKDEKGPKYKVWLIMYTCGATRAVHFEAVKSRNVQDFLDANSRFMDSEGIPMSFISDHEGAFKKGGFLYEQVAKSKRVRQEFSKNRISWQFYTERSPNKGGFIERLNDSVKKAFYKVLRNRTATFEEFRTLAVHAKSVINDRPLTYLYSDIGSEYKALSPSMLLRGYNIGEAPHLNLHKYNDQEEEKLGEKYLRQEKMKNSLWNFWSDWYLKDLFSRHVNQKKAQKELVVPKMGEVVLVFGGEKVPRRSWRMGKIVGMGDKKRGAIRQVTVQMLSPSGKTLSKLNRPPEQLVPLEVDSSQETFDVEALRNLEGDPRITSTRLSRNYSKKQLSLFKKSKIWPPYSVSHRFLDPSVQNIGPEKDFIHGVFKGQEAGHKNFGSRKHVTFNMDED